MAAKNACFGLGFAWLASCGTANETAPRLLAPLTGLQEINANDDPLASHRPPAVDCNPLTGWYAEDDELEIDTLACNYAALSEPAATSVTRGEHIVTTLSHYDLTAAEPAEAHVAILAGTVVLFETSIAVPGPADLIEIDIVAQQDIARGTPLVFHLHNHGQNTWQFAPLEVHP